jgi:hypothetical protein
MRNAAVYQFELALPRFITEAGLITDELQDKETGISRGALLQTTKVTNPLDERILVEQRAGVNAGSGGSYSYEILQSVRQYGNQAIGALVAYDTIPADTASARVLRGELYAMEGYAEVMLADLFCSGVPLSTLDFNRDYTFRASSSTAQVYADAIAKFDTALVLAVGNDSIVNLARVGRGRAWLNLGQFDSAAAAVQDVPLAFHYITVGDWDASMTGLGDNVLSSLGTVSDREGINGLPFRSSGDPRSAVVSWTFGSGQSVFVEYFPQKYQTSRTGTLRSPIVVADGIEAQLILAETQLQPVSSPRGPWLETLNTLRESIGLSDTTDPGTAVGRIKLLFTERAYWLFMTGHRQGDLRRLIHVYGSTDPVFREQDRVYPIGVYTAPGTGLYGSDVTAPIPSSEYNNPLYHGCKDRGA